MWRPSNLLAAIALAGCATGPAAHRSADYSALIQLRGATITLLQDRRLSGGEARVIKGQLDFARRAVDAGNLKAADVVLDAARAYLAARQGQPL